MPLKRMAFVVLLLVATWSLGWSLASWVYQLGVIAGQSQPCVEGK